VGTDSTPPQPAEKPRSSADTPSSPEDFASELWNLDLHEHCADLDAWRAAAEKLIAERDCTVRAEERERVLAAMEKLNPEAIRAGGGALERQYRASLWEEAKEVAEEADVEAIWHAMLAAIRIEKIGESEERTSDE